MRLIIIFAGLLVSLQSCVTAYQPMAFDYIPVHTTWNAIDQPTLRMFIEPDVLHARGMKPYAAMERKNNVDLVEVTVHNTGTSDFIIARDVVFQTTGGGTIVPLPLHDALTALVEPVTEETGNSAVEVEAPSSFRLLWGAGKVANTASRGSNHVRFVTDISEHYVTDRIVAPGSMMRGLLVLPVAQGTAIKTMLRQ